MSVLRSKNLLDLPNKILVNIVQFLPVTYIKSVRQTCSKLCQITYSKEVLKKQQFVFQLKKSKEVETMLIRLIELDLSCLNVRIDILNHDYDENTTKINSIIWKILCLFGTNIISLTLRANHSNLSLKVLEDILFMCVNLEELYLNKIKFKGPETSRIRPEYTNTRLKTLKISACYLNSALPINVFLNFYPCIETFELLPVLQETGMSDYKFVANNPEIDRHIVHTITMCNKSIRRLNIRSTNLLGFQKTEFLKLATSELKLHSICLTEENYISMTEFKTLISKQNNLNQIKITNCKWFETKCLSHLITHCPKLERLHVRNTMNRILSFPGHLQIETPTEIGWKVMDFKRVTICGKSRFLRMPNLEHLNLIECLIEDQGMDFLFLENCHLKHLCIENCNLNATDILRIVNVFQDTLITLKLIAPSCFEYLANIPNIHFAKLQELEIEARELVTKTIVKQFNFPCLKSLIFKSYKLKKQDGSKIVNGCPLLEHLYLWTDEKWNDEALLKWSTSFHFLEEFSRQDDHGFHTILQK